VCKKTRNIVDIKKIMTKEETVLENKLSWEHYDKTRNRVDRKKIMTKQETVPENKK